MKFLFYLMTKGILDAGLSQGNAKKKKAFAASASSVRETLAPSLVTPPGITVCWNRSVLFHASEEMWH